MTMAAQLMAAGANQQLIASKLQEGHNIGPGATANGSGVIPLQEKQSRDGTELSIGHEEPQNNGHGATPPAESADKPVADLVNAELSGGAAPTGENSGQLELEKQLAGLTGPSTGTMADIEKELQEKAAGTEPPKEGGEGVEGAPQALTAASDATMPGFEAPAPPAPGPEAPAPPPVEEPLPALPPLPQVTEEPKPSEPQPVFPVAAPTDQPSIPESPQILNEHGSLSMGPEMGGAPINGIQEASSEEQPTVDPFAGPEAPQESTPVASESGTPEGAAALAEGTSPAAPPPAPVETSNIPSLPPLPPVPTDGSMPPLPLPPPPPPPPPFPTGGAMPSGAVSGDVFGDGSAAPDQGQNPPTAPEPGQFKIPGS
jgi:hypothetical protein